MSNTWLTKFWNEKITLKPVHRLTANSERGVVWQGYYEGVSARRVQIMERTSVKSLDIPDGRFTTSAQEEWDDKIKTKKFDYPITYDEVGVGCEYMTKQINRRYDICEICWLPAENSWTNYDGLSEHAYICNNCDREKRMSYRRMVGRYCWLNHQVPWREASEYYTHSARLGFDCVLESRKESTLDFFKVTSKTWLDHLAFRIQHHVFHYATLLID